MRIIKPPKLKPGDKIGIISPSEPIVYKKKFARGVETLKKLGFRVVLGKNIFKKYGAYMAGADKERAADLNAMFRNPEIKGIFCSRGGFNSNRLLDLIDYTAIKKKPKVFMGFSDITVLLNAIHKKTGLITFHGQNVEFGFSRGFAGRNKYTLEYFKKTIMTTDSIGKVKSWGKIEILNKGRATGVLIGGNLSVLMTLLGTEYEPEWKDKILFWEETEQTAQDIDFWLTHLRLRGVFNKISGMVIGKVNIKPLGGSLENKKVLSMNKIIFDLCKNHKFPIIKGVAFGHYWPQITLPVGAKASIDTSKSSPFSIDEAAVR